MCEKERDVRKVLFGLMLGRYNAETRERIYNIIKVLRRQQFNKNNNDNNNSCRRHPGAEVHII